MSIGGCCRRLGRCSVHGKASAADGLAESSRNRGAGRRATKDQLRGPAVRRLFASRPARRYGLTHQQRCEGAALLAPPEAVLTGRSAATVLGVELARAADPVEFAVDERYRFGPIRGITSSAPR